MNNLAQMTKLLEDHPEGGEWILKKANSNDFANSLLTFYINKGRLSEKQLFHAVKNQKKMLEMEAQQETETADNQEEIAKEKAFKYEKIRNFMNSIKGLKNPSIQYKNLRIKLTTHARNTAYVGICWIDRGAFGTGIGKIMGDGTLQKWTRKGFTDEDERHLKELESNPLEQLKIVGRELGVCLICGRELSNDESIEIGIGPICLGRLEGGE